MQDLPARRVFPLPSSLSRACVPTVAVADNFILLVVRGFAR